MFLAIFISPTVGALVALGTSLGFLLAGFPYCYCFESAVTFNFALVAAYWLKKYQEQILKTLPTFMFALIVNLLHGLAEFVVVYVLTATSNSGIAYIWSLVGLIGFGSMVHGIVDFYIAYYLWKILSQKLGLTFQSVQIRARQRSIFRPLFE